MEALLAVIEELFLLNKRFSLKRIQRVWETYRRWLNPHMTDGGYSLTLSEFLYIVEVKSAAEDDEARRFFDRMKVLTVTNGREQLDLLEFLLTFTVLSRGAWDDKCKFLFHLMDFDVEDEIAEEELAMLITIVCDGLRKFEIFSIVPSFDEITAMAADGFLSTDVAYGTKMNFNQFVNWCVFHTDPLALVSRLTCGFRVRALIHGLRALAHAKHVYLTTDPYYHYQTTLLTTTDALEAMHVVCGPVVGQITDHGARILYEFSASGTVEFYAFCADKATSPMPSDVGSMHLSLQEKIALAVTAYEPLVVEFNTLAPRTAYTICLVGAARSDRTACVARVMTAAPLDVDDSAVSLHLFNHWGHTPSLTAERLSFDQAFHIVEAAPHFAINVHWHLGLLSPRTVLDTLDLLRRAPAASTIALETAAARIASHFRATMGHHLLQSLFGASSNLCFTSWRHVMYGMFTPDDLAAVDALHVPHHVQWLETRVQEHCAKYMKQLWPPREEAAASVGTLTIGRTLVLLLDATATPNDIAPHLPLTDAVITTVVLTPEPLVPYQIPADASLPSILEPLKTWKLRSSVSKLVVASATTSHHMGVESSITFQDTTTSFSQLVVGHLRPTLAYEDPTPPESLPSYQVAKYVVQHMGVISTTHVGAVHAHATMSSHEACHPHVNVQLRATQPSTPLHVVVGPVVGLVTSSDVSILLECDRQVLLVCHVIDRVTHATFTCKATTVANRPVVFRVDNLLPHRTYDVQFQGLPHLSVAFHTRQARASAVHLTCVANDHLFPAEDINFAPLSTAWHAYTTNVLAFPSTDATIYFGQHVATLNMVETAMRVWEAEPENVERIADCFRHAIRAHWHANRHVLSHGSHWFVGAGFDWSAYTVTPLSRQVVAVAQEVAWEYQQHAQTSASARRRYCYHVLDGVGFLHLDLLEHRLQTPHEYLQNTPQLLSPEQWALIEMVLTSSSADAHCLVITCDEPIVWHLRRDDIPVALLWRDWIMYPTELSKLLRLCGAWVKAEAAARNLLFLCGGLCAATTTIQDTVTGVAWQQLVVGPVSNPLQLPPTGLPDSGTLLDTFDVHHAFTSGEAVPQYVSVCAVPHPTHATFALHQTPINQPSALVLVGPVIGKLTATTVRVLIEVDRSVDACTCVCTNVLTKERHTSTSALVAYRPFAFSIATLAPATAYTVSFEGITSLDEASAFQTPHVTPCAFDCLVVHDSNWRNLAPPGSSWLALLQGPSYHAKTAAATATDNNDPLQPAENLWRHIHDTTTALPLRRPLVVIHNGAQVHLRHAFTEKELVAMVQRMLAMPQDEWKKVMRPEIQHRLQSVYRVQWNVPPFRDALRTCSHVMLLDEDDLYFTASLVDAKFDDHHDEVAQILHFFRQVAQTVWFFYQNQLWTDLQEDVLATRTSSFVPFGATTLVVLNKNLTPVAADDALADDGPKKTKKGKAKIEKRNSTKTTGIDLTKVAQANNLLPPAAWLVLDDAIIATKATECKLMVVVVCVDLIEVSMASMFLTGVTRLLEKLFDWKNQRLNDRDVVVLMQSTTTNDAYDVTDQRSHATIRLVPVGSITDATRHASPSYPVAGGRFSKRFSFAPAIGDTDKQPFAWTKGYGHFHVASDLQVVQWYHVAHWLPTTRPCHAITGPILGRMDVVDDEVAAETFVTVSIVLEVNAAASITCVVVDVLANVSTRVTLDVEPYEPTTFRCSKLSPSRRYAYSFDGLANRDERKGTFHTPSTHVDALNLVALSLNFPQVRVAASPNLWEALHARLQVPWHGIDLVVHVGGQVQMQNAADDCLRWLQTQPTTSTLDMRRLMRTRFQQEYRAAWNVPYVRTVLGQTSQLMMWSTSDIATFFGRSKAILVKESSDEDAELMEMVVAEAKATARMYYDALGWRTDLDDEDDGADDGSGAATADKGVATDTKSSDDANKALVRPDYFAVRMGLIAMFVFDMKSTTAGDQITCNNRLTTPPSERPLISEAQWLAFERICRKKSVRALVLVMELPLLVTAKPESFPGATLAAHWLACPAQLDQLLSLLFRWKQKVDGRDVVILSGNLHLGLDTFIQDTKSTFGFHSFVTGPIAAPVEPFAFEDQGKVMEKRFSFAHRFSPPQANYVLVEVALLEETQPDQSVAYSALVNGDLIHADNMRVMHDPQRLNRWPAWWKNYCPMAATAFWSDIVLKAQSTADVARYVREETALTNLLKPFYVKYNFIDTTRMEELQSASPTQAVARFRDVLRDVWQAVPDAIKHVCADVEDPFVLDIALKQLTHDIAGPIDMNAFQAICKDLIMSAARVYAATSLHVEDEQAAAQTRRQDAVRAQELARREAMALESEAKRETEHLAELQKRSILEYAQEKNRLDKEKEARAAAARDAAKEAKKAARDAEKERQRDEDVAIRKERKALKTMKQALDDQTAARGGAQTDESLEKEIEWTRRNRLVEARAQRREEQKYREGVRKDAKKQKKDDDKQG
ncbi:Aste57867_21614 [Aphanomyces stellatus]|uniref:Aste57867_21614 protein n=1 Tax=Aphanomyces stellatus TaxID=120398 RepID=A0A485LIP6_9STRA|nr:hypothetical protein As57867_021545 [Aphanomyces stellatus]VFT98284.1 Aste57867_21614 [Aphanomyces stellatus]